MPFTSSNQQCQGTDGNAFKLLAIFCSSCVMNTSTYSCYLGPLQCKKTAERRQSLGEEMYGIQGRGLQTKRQTQEDVCKGLIVLVYFCFPLSLHRYCCISILVPVKCNRRHTTKFYILMMDGMMSELLISVRSRVFEWSLRRYQESSHNMGDLCSSGWHICHKFCITC